MRGSEPTSIIGYKILSYLSSKNWHISVGCLAYINRHCNYKIRSNLKKNQSAEKPSNLLTPFSVPNHLNPKPSAAAVKTPSSTKPSLAVNRFH